MAEITIDAEADWPALRTIRLPLAEQDPCGGLIFDPVMKHYCLQKIVGLTSNQQA